MRQMDDPYVAELVYTINTPTRTRSVVVYPEKLEGSTDGFKWSLDGVDFSLTVRPISHFSNDEEAREALEDKVTALVTYWGIEAGVPMNVEHRRTSLVDRQHPGLAGTISGEASVQAYLVVAHQFTPTPPPEWFLQEPVPRIVRELLNQWALYRGGQAGFLDRSYFCLSYLETVYGDGPVPPKDPTLVGRHQHGSKRRAAAQRLAVDIEILCRLGDLTASEDPRYWRKAGGGGPTELADDDLRWVQAVVPRLIRRAWEVEAKVVDLPFIAMTVPIQVPHHPDNRERASMPETE